MSADSFIKKHVGEPFELTPLTGDAGTRTYSRVQEGPKSYVLCVYKKAELEQFHNYSDIQKLFSSHEIFVPQTFAQENNLMLLEDLGDVTLEDIYKKNIERGKGFYITALDQLAKVQKIPNEGDSKAQSYSFDPEKFNWELNFALEHLTNLLSLSLGPSFVNSLKNDFDKLSKFLCDLPKVITHRDFHSRNIMLHENKLHIIDFQDARLGPKFYDLVSLIEDSYTGLTQGFKKELMKTYCKKTNIDFNAEFEQLYHTQNIQRSLKSCGSFASLKNLKGNERYLAYLKPALDSLLKSCEFTGQYTHIKDFTLACSESWRPYDS